MITRRNLLSYTGLSAAAIAAGVGLSTLPAMARGGKTQQQRRRDRHHDKKKRRRNRRH